MHPPESFPRLRREVVALDPALRERIAGDWLAARDRQVGSSPWPTVGVFGAMVLALGVGIGDRFDAWPAGLAVGAVGAALLARATLRRDRAFRAQVDGDLAALRAAPHAIRHTLDLAGPHLLACHEHGIFVLAPLAPGRTFCVDFDDCADHPCHGPVDDALRQQTLTSQWVWHDVPAGDGRTFHWQAFAMTGAPLAPTLRDEFDADELGAFIDLFGDEWHPEDGVAKVDFAAIIAGDAALRARRQAAAPPRK
ncbi:MAG: hypothetical protein ACK5S5_15195 [Planctomycetota bacterium]|jgi:hypothetical protein